MPLISVSHLTKDFRVAKKEPGLKGLYQSLFARQYDVVHAVQEISFTIEQGEVVGFIGPNGAGKTTTLKCLSGLLYPTSGQVEVLGYTPYERKHAFLRNIALVMGQKNQLWWDLPAMDTFLLNKEIYGISEEQFKKRLSDLVSLLDVSGQLQTPVKSLSLGQRMKMELIAALLHNPKMLFLDEPTIGLDVVMQKTMREFLKAYNSQYNATIMLTSHYMKDVETLCERVIVINFGRILFDGKLTSLVQQFAPYKKISVTLGERIDPKNIHEIGLVVDYSYPVLTLHVEGDRVTHAVSQLLAHFRVEDVAIEEPAIEDVVREVFAKGKEHEA